MTGTIDIVDIQDLKLIERRPGFKGAILFNENTPTKFIFSGIFTLIPGGKLNMHYHDCEEMQHVIDGYGILRDSENKEHQLRHGTTFYCHSGLKGAHEIKNTGNVPFVCLYIYPSPGGKRVSSTRLAD